MLANRTTSGAQWELKKATASLRPESLLLFFPQDIADRDKSYASYRESVSSYFEKPCRIIWEMHGLSDLTATGHQFWSGRQLIY